MCCLMELRCPVLLLVIALFAVQTTGLSKQIGSTDALQKQGRVVRQTCDPSETRVNGRQVCKNDVLFEDNFDTLDETKWRKDKMIATGPDYEFVLYDDSPQHVSTKDGIVHLKPTVPDEVQKFALYGRIDLRTKGCTGDLPEECSQNASAYNILPPVLSGRIRTSKSFTFKYGVVEVRAKLPEGNWLYPQIWLEPVEKFYGPGYDSGRIVIATSRGNPELLTSDNDDLGSILLSGGLILRPDEPERSQFLRSKRLNPTLEETWNENFHTFKLQWRPDGVIMSVDGEDYGAVNAVTGGFGIVYETNTWDSGSAMAPFDREFFITLGVGAGGIRHFPDNTTVGGQPKPWRNRSAKAKLDFLRDRKNWKDSWAWEEAALQVDYIKVWAL